MGFVWSDEVATELLARDETAPLVPDTWLSRPSAFVAESDETPESVGRRLLGLSAPAPNPSGECTCMAADRQVDVS